MGQGGTTRGKYRRWTYVTWVVLLLVMRGVGAWHTTASRWSHGTQLLPPGRMALIMLYIFEKHLLLSVQQFPYNHSDPWGVLQFYCDCEKSHQYLSNVH